MNKFNILWLDDEFEPGSEHYLLLLEWKRKTEEKHPFSIKTCVNGNFLSEWFKRDEYVWDAIVFDINGYISETLDNSDHAPEDVLGTIFDDCKNYIEQHGVLKYCFTGAENVTNKQGTSVVSFLKMSGFERDIISSKPFYDKINGPDRLFNAIEEALNAKNPKFKGFPSFKVVYDAVVDENAKTCIEKIIDWYNASKDSNNDEEQIEFPHIDLRYVLEDIYKNKLKSLGFFRPNPNDGKCNPYKFINATFDRGTTPYLNTQCRLEWEAVTIDFLGDVVNKAKHIGLGRHDKNYDWLVFNAFVIFSNWYAKFINAFYDHEKDMCYFFTTGYLNFLQSQPITTDPQAKADAERHCGKVIKNYKENKVVFKVQDNDDSHSYNIDYAECTGLNEGDTISYCLKDDSKGWAKIAYDIEKVNAN